MGHEFAAEVLEVGPDTDAPAPGTIVTSIPVLLSGSGIEPIVYSQRHSRRLRRADAAVGAAALPDAQRARPAPRGADRADGGRPPRRQQVGDPAGEGALVLGCGPVGLAVIAALRARGIGPIVAADFSPPGGRWRSRWAPPRPSTRRDGVDAWSPASGPAVVFEAIGVPGIIDEILRLAPVGARVVVVGVCMEPDTFMPFFGIGKELSVQFVLGYDPIEFADSLRPIAEGEIDVTPMITGEVGLDGVADAFAELGAPRGALQDPRHAVTD